MMRTDVSSVMKLLVLHVFIVLPTMTLTRVRKCALELEDTSLLSKLAPGDMIAFEANHHGRCHAAQCTTELGMLEPCI